MKKLGKKREISMRTIEAYVTCYPSTCDSYGTVCACNCSAGTSMSMAPPQSTNCQTENATHWVAQATQNGRSPYYAPCSQ
ncbi:MAG: hypothetical protein K0S76_2398 [Herbinix sp.]|jgi:putative bacteriocin precursor|nr:hypothetical protein [Herbinix sp.]